MCFPINTILLKTSSLLQTMAKMGWCAQTATLWSFLLKMGFLVHRLMVDNGAFCNIIFKKTMDQIGHFTNCILFKRQSITSDKILSSSTNMNGNHIPSSRQPRPKIVEVMLGSIDFVSIKPGEKDYVNKILKEKKRQNEYTRNSIIPMFSSGMHPKKVQSPISQTKGEETTLRWTGGVLCEIAPPNLLRWRLRH